MYKFAHPLFYIIVFTIRTNHEYGYHPTSDDPSGTAGFPMPFDWV